jgi:hypothetical protein
MSSFSSRCTFQIFPLHLVESKPPLPLAYINPATPCIHEFGKREEAFYPQPSPDTSHEAWEVESILARRVSRRRLDYLFSWVGLLGHENVWIP